MTEHAEVAAQVKEAADRVKTVAENVQTEIKNFGKVTDETKATADEALVKATEAGARLVDIEQKLARRAEADEKAAPQSLGAQVASDEGLQTWGKAGAKGSFRVKAVTPVTSGGASAGALGNVARETAVIRPPRQGLRIRDLLTVVPTTAALIEFVRQTGFTNSAAIVAEGGMKPQSDIKFTPDNEAVKTIAHWVHVSRQIMDDAPQLQGIIDSELRFGLDIVEEREILRGDGTALHLNGLVPQATDYAAPFALPGGSTKIDQLRLALLQAALAEYPANGIVLNPIDWASIELTKDNSGRYIFANPQSLAGPTLWGQPVVETQAMNPTEFLAGAFAMAATYYERMTTEVLISSEDRDNFVTNMLTVRAEKRGAVAVKRPEALIFGTLADTPAV